MLAKIYYFDVRCERTLSDRFSPLSAPRFLAPSSALAHPIFCPLCSHALLMTVLLCALLDGCGERQRTAFPPLFRAI